MPTLDEFRALLLDKADAFNRRDWEAVVDGFPENFEWFFPSEVIDRPGPARPDELQESLADLVSQFPDMTVEPIEIVEPKPGSFVVRLRVLGGGAASGAQTRLDLAQLWEFEGEHPVRLREFTDVSEALAKARQ